MKKIINCNFLLIHFTSKLYYGLFFTFFALFTSYAQVGINTTSPDASSILDVNATDKGLLIPRVSLTNVTTTMLDGTNIAATGLLIYNTNASVIGGSGVGYYSFTGTIWEKLITSASNVEKINDLLDGKSDNDGSQNGSSVFLGVDAGLNDNESDNRNVGVGYQTLYSNTTGDTNTATGYRALYSNTIGDFNTAYGYQALYSNTTGIGNIANGYLALYSNTTGISNIANGYKALFSNTTGDFNTAYGYRALNSNTTGFSNIANGYLALYSNTTGNRNTANGYASLYSNTTGNYNTVYGFQALYSNTTGFSNIANGSNSLYSNTTGNSNTANGYLALYHNTTGNRNISFGVNSGRYVEGSNNVFIGAQSGSNNPGNTRVLNGSVFIGNLSGFNETNDNRLFIENTNADENNALIYGNFGTDNTTTGNILRTNSQFQIGNPSASGFAFPTIDGTTNQILATNGSGAVNWTDANTLISPHSINDLLDGKSDNDGTQNGSSVFLGVDAGLNDNESDNRNVGVGYQTLYSNTTGFENVATGYQSLYSNTIGSYNTANGYKALFSNTTGNYNTAYGYRALNSNTTGFSNIANGYASLYSNTTGNNNIANGYTALFSNTTGFSNIANGTNSLYSNTTGNYNTANGSNSLYSNTTGNYNTANGNFALENNTTGNSNTANGYLALRNNTTGNSNISFGVNSGRYVEGSNNVFIGAQSGSNNPGNTRVLNGSVFLGNLSGFNETNDNRLFIENTNADENNALIYGNFGTDNTTTGNILRINGQLQLGTTTANRYFMPTARGSANQVMQTDGSGNLSWVTPSTGDITGVTAGTGLTGGGNSGTVILNVIATNGITANSNDIRLGGTLVENTNISQGSYNMIFNLNNTGDFKVQDSGIDHFEVQNNGNSYFGGEVFWNDGSTTGTILARLYDGGSGNDGSFSIYYNGNVQHSIFGANTSVFNELGIDVDFRIEGDTETNLLRVDAGNDRIGIMEASPDTDIHLKQSSNSEVGSGGMTFESSFSTNQWKIYHSGSHFSFAENGVRRAYVTAATGAYVATSDRRLKKNITQITSILNKVKQLKAYRYLYNDQDISAKKTIGFMAQDVLPLFPELVELAEDGYYGLNYAGFGVVAIKAVQELTNKVEQQQIEIETLKNKNKNLEQRMAKIEALLQKN